MENQQQQQTRGGRGQGRGRGNRNPVKQDDAPKHVDPTAAVPQQQQQQDRRENRTRGGRGGSNNNNNQAPAAPAPAVEAPVANSDQQQRRGRGARGGRGGNNNTAAATTEEASFSVTAAAPTPAPVTVTAPTSTTTFAKLGLLDELLKATSDLGYKAPSPIQQQAIPKVLAGIDVLAGAQTGTGKTAGFSLPILQLLYQKYFPNGKPSAAAAGGRNGQQPLRVLVLTPTRELAAQVESNITDLAKYLPKPFFTSTCIVGGVAQGPQVTALKKRPSILVATPGRLIDFHQQGVVDLSQIEFCVLDEADRMLDMGFYPDVSKILAVLPKDKQSLLFSATFTPEIRKLAGKILRGPISEVQVTPPNSTVERIQQSFYLVSREKKDEALVHIIEANKWNQVLVFTRTKGGANQVSSMLAKNKISSLALHGGKSQSARTGALADFKSGQLRVLVATDIAARGLDIEDLPHVVNYEIPNVPEDYVHRIGRTGRAGKEGFAVSLVSLDEEGFLNNILKFAGKADIPRKNDIPAAFAPAKDEVAQPIAMGQMTLWGGAGPMPPKSVMDAAGREKRREIANNIRERKEAERNAKAAKEATKASRAGNHVPKPTTAANGPHGSPPHQQRNTHAAPQQRSSNHGNTAANAAPKQRDVADADRNPRYNPQPQGGRGGRGGARGGRN